MAAYFYIYQTASKGREIHDDDALIETIGLEKGLHINNADDAACAFFHHKNQPYTLVGKWEHGNAVYASQGQLYRFVP